MKKSALLLNTLLITSLFLTFGVKATMAAPHLIMSPSTGNYSINDTFTVTIKIDSASQVSYGADGVGTYDSTKLELVSMTKASPMAFDIVEGGADCSPAIISEVGKFSFSCYPNDLVGAKPANGDLMVMTFKAKASGTAIASFTCAANSTVDSNIVDNTQNDSIVCSENISGSYTIAAATGGNTTVTPTTAVTATTTTATELPQTGGIASTIGLIVFGAISLASALFLKFL